MCIRDSIEINRHRNRLILSERQAVQERRDAMKEKLIEELTEGEVRKGRVSSICDFGAFVDIGGADGLVHLSELSWSRVRHPSEVLKVGEEVDVHVLGINADEKKIALSIKRTQPEPWSRVATSYEVGQLVKGTVTQLANFGAFARIEDGIEGLIHVSELAEERIQHPKQVVEESEELILRIIRIDPQRRRMGLSLRRALDTPDSERVEGFGDESREESDALARKIRAKLDAEGLTGQVQAPAPEQKLADGEEPAVLREVDSEAASQAAGEAQVAAFEERRKRAEESEQQRQRRQDERRQRQSSSSSSFAGDDMSAMAMAFAMAGADDLISGNNSKPAAAAAETAEDASTDSEEATAKAAGQTVAEVATEPEEANAEAEPDAADETVAEVATEPEEVIAEAEPDAADETVAEVATEPEEVTAEAEPDAADETVAEVATEPEEATAEAEPDAADETVAEVATEPEEVSAEAEPDAADETVAEVATEPEEVTAEAEPDAADETVAEVATEPEEVTAEAEPEASDENQAVAQASSPDEEVEETEDSQPAVDEAKKDETPEE